MRQKQEDSRHKKENKKKRKLEVEGKGKELEERRKKSAKIREPKMIRAEVSPSHIHLLVTIVQINMF